MRDFKIRRPNGGEVFAMREETGKGIEECKRIIVRECLHDAVAQARDFEDLKLIIHEMIDL